MILAAESVRNEQATVVRRRASDGVLRVYASKRKSDHLAELRLGAFTAPEDGRIRSEPESIQKDASARNTGNAKWYRVFEPDGRSLVWEGDVSGLDGEGSLKFDSTEIHQGAAVSVSSITYSVP